MPASRTPSRTPKHPQIPSSSRVLRSHTSTIATPTTRQTANNKKPRDDTKTPLLRLPCEIRQQILSYTITDEIILYGIRLDVQMHEDEECSVNWNYGYNPTDNRWYDIENWAKRLRNLHPVLAREMRWVLQRWRARSEFLGPMKQKIWAAMFGDRFWNKLLHISSRGEYPLWYIHDDIVQTPRFDVIWGRTIRGTWFKSGPVLMSLRFGLDQSDDVKALVKHVGRKTKTEERETGYVVVFERGCRDTDGDKTWFFR